ncbi:hypothetical protein HNR26_004774 [Rhizobium rosettiformans]|uniref:Uncharacterized protein n=2 Tax=Rhizobium rosettiformans TaxID=1368430 RepID=A0A4S8PIX7_9HYPH|nr:hypothetical protein [Rhizobium rosettiformans]MBB5278672.1 hypothetical protein [Rhizobium rosettiformans]THV29941.1 hypothetical protein FAA86_23050 [Rhizobium rosettiformans W3]
MTHIQPGSLVRLKRSVAQKNKWPRPVSVVTMIEMPYFSAVNVTGARPGSQIKHKLDDYELVPDDVEIKIRQPKSTWRPGDLVVDDHGNHVVVTSVRTIPDNGLFAGTALDETPVFYRGQFSEHWKASGFKLVRRREDMIDEKTRQNHRSYDVQQAIRRLRRPIPHDPRGAEAINF